MGLESPSSSPLPASSPAGGSGAGFFLGFSFLLFFTREKNIHLLFLHSLSLVIM